jgi:hypothetical protein
LVDRSRDPECDAARALLARGITGKLTMLDGKTGGPQTIIDIEEAAGLITSQENRDGLRFRKPPRATDNSPPSPETGSVMRKPHERPGTTFTLASRIRCDG